MKKMLGFTLLEVMIALAIMATLGLLTSQAIRAAMSNREFVSGEISRDSRLADSIRILRSDIAKAFHYRDIFCKMNNDLNAQPTPAPAPAPGQPAFAPPSPIGSQPGTASTPKPCPPAVTGFIGDSESLYFTALANNRTIRDSQESDQAKIGYFVKTCTVTASTGKPKSSKCLYRSLSPYLDTEIEKPGPETMLVENVEEFKLRYLGPEKEDYQNSWKTGANGDDATREKFPYAVEITLTLHDKSNPKDKAISETVIAPIWFENNEKKSSKPSADQDQGRSGS